METSESPPSPPSYWDLGKMARDLFANGYHFGLWKLDCNSKTQSGIEFNTHGQSNQDTGKVFGWLESKYKFADYGVSLLERWSTDNTLFTDVSVQDQLTEGLMLGVETTYSPQTGDKDGKIKLAYAHENVKLDLDTNIDLEGPMINAAAVVGFQGILAGYQTIFNTKDSTFTKHNVAVGFSAAEFAIHAALIEGEIINGSIYHKTMEKLDTGLQMTCTSKGEEIHFGLGCKYQMDHDATVRAKISHEAMIGLSYQQMLREGITLTLSTLINSKEFTSGGHKIGVALELVA